MLTFGLAWLAAAVVASAVAWQGVGLIGAQVTDSRPETLSAGQIDAELAERAGSASTTDADQPGAAVSTEPADAGGPATGGPTTAVPGATDDGTTTGSDGSTATTSSPTTTPPAVERRTATMLGGTAAFEYSGGTVRLLYARPAPGYDVERDDRDDGGIRVEFEGEDGTSRVDAWWDGRARLEPDDHGATGDDDRGGDDDNSGEGGGGGDADNSGEGGGG